MSSNSFNILKLQVGEAKLKAMGLAGLLAIIFAVFLLAPNFRKDAPSSSSQISNGTEQVVAVVDTDPKSASLTNTLEDKLKEHDRAMAALESIDLTEDNRVWTISDSVIDERHKYNQAIKESHVINLPDNWQDKFEVGEKVNLSLPNHDLEGRVKDITTHPNGDKSYMGHTSVAGIDYSFVVTIGDKITFATILTPDGEYSAQIQGNTGSLTRTPTVSELSSDDRLDYVIPPIAPNHSTETEHNH